MSTRIFVEGRRSEDGSKLICPMPTSSVLYFLRYCQTICFQVQVVQHHEDDLSEDYVCVLNFDELHELNITFTSWNDVPVLIKNVTLPSLEQPELSLVRSGLCVVLRHIVIASHKMTPDLHNIDILGFRQGSMKMCAEVSGWTKLCEVELPNSMASLIHVIRKRAETGTPGSAVEFPLDLMKLEEHFKKKCLVHNDNRKKRVELTRLKQALATWMENALELSGVADKVKLEEREQRKEAKLSKKDDAETIRLEPGFIEHFDYSKTHLSVVQVLNLSHGIRKVEVNKTFTDLNGENECFKEGKNELSELPCIGDLALQELPNTALDVSGLDYITKEESATKNTVNLKSLCSNVETAQKVMSYVNRLTSEDIEFVHVYSEGIEMTLADLILIVDIYFLLESLEFQCTALIQHVPRILQWAKHMISLSKVFSAGKMLGLNMAMMEKCLETYLYDSPGSTEKFFDTDDNDTGFKGITFIQMEEEQEDEEEMELSRCARMKHKAIKPEVIQVMKKFEELNAMPDIGNHPCGENVTVEWDTLPPGVHPKEGDVPEKRTRRKCQQVENLVTAVQAVARPGDVIVDFCSGGGHLGIVLAYLLPECEVYLVENKEESLLKACARLESLDLRNVTLFQCNMDYFVGKFNVGVCLHACGSATDMVLQLCLNSSASFVICPCCYGSIHKTHLLDYPRSKRYVDLEITYRDFLTLGHAADQTEFNIALEGQGRQCMNFVDADRAEYAREQGYSVSLCSLKPLSCTPKNNLLVGTSSTDS